MKNKLNFKCEGNAVTIKIYGEVGDNFWEKYEAELLGEERDEEVVQNLDELNKRLNENKNVATIDIYINSCGGSVFDGVAMYNMLKRHPAYKRVFIDGFACSVASVIAMCGNQVIMPSASMMMIHNAWTVAMGNAKELRKQAEDLDKINETIKNAYRKKMKISDEKLDELMDNESYLSADECLEYGLCTKISDNIDGVDNEQVQNKVNEALDKISGLYQNKLDSLTAMKNCIKDIENEEVETAETDEATTGETEEVIDPVEKENPVDEAIETEEEVIDTDKAQEEVHNIQENALKRFFNLQEDKKDE